MEQPCDRSAAGRPPRWASFAFDLPPAAALDAPLAAGFGALLSRYNAFEPVVIAASRLTPPEEVSWRATLRLDATMESRYRQLLDQAASTLGLQSDAASLPAGTDGPQAGIIFLDSQESLEKVRSLPQERGEDLRLLLAPGARACFVFNADLFSAEMVQRAAGHLKKLLTHACSQDETTLARLPMLTSKEREFIRSVCDGPARPEPPPFVHRSFEARAAKAPAALAVRFKDSSLTYGALNARANALARRLAAEGVAAEQRVAVCLEPSLELPLALLAALKSGGAYVPLDPTHPEARLRALLEDVKPRVLITRKGLLDKLGPTSATVVTVEELDTLLAGQPAGDLDTPIDPRQTAYIYFTSGTTGAPKGAMASYANLAAYIAAARERYDIGPADVVPALARFTFSISMFELMSPLAAGGTLLILEREHVLDPERMTRTLQEVTLFHAGPSLLKAILPHIRRAYSSFEAFSRVRHASSGGDMVPPELLESLKQVFPNAEVFVIYGSSEIGCMGCTYPVPRDRVVERTYVGRPFAGMSVRVLDPALNELPVGVVGEICFSGAGVIKGYLGRPELTAERFVEIDGRRFYRMGDVGRLTEDGWIEMLGRADFQVKIRGVRIEPAEVEQSLRRAPGVRDAVVAPYVDPSGEKALAGYVVLEHPAGAREAEAIEAIKAHMQLAVPDYMLPSAYLVLEKLPLNHNMKVDRKALPPIKAQRRTGAPARPPESDAERRIAALWSRLLGLESVGLDDRFFDLGGHSLLGLRLLVEIERELGVKLKGLDIVRETLEGLAALCDAALGRAPASRTSAGAASATEPLRFGDGGALYGVFTGDASSCARAALICPPLGQDYARSRFILQRVMTRLAAGGVASLLFDFYGCGDSYGDAGGLARWRADVVDAYRELKRRVGNAPVTAVGIRLGAAPLLQALAGLDVASVVLWDPVCDGARWFAETAATHERFIGRWRRLFRPPPPLPGLVELLGLTCTEEAARELRELSTPPLGRPVPLRWLATCELAEQRRRFESLGGATGGLFREHDRLIDWSELDTLAESLPDPGVSKALAELTLEAP